MMMFILAVLLGFRLKSVFTITLQAINFNNIQEIYYRAYWTLLLYLLSMLEAVSGLSRFSENNVVRLLFSIWSYVKAFFHHLMVWCTVSGGILKVISVGLDLFSGSSVGVLLLASLVSTIKPAWSLLLKIPPGSKYYLYLLFFFFFFLISLFII